MRTMKTISILFYILFVCVASGYSQVVLVGSESLTDKLRLNKGLEGINDALYSDIVGDPYIFKDFHAGKVTLKTGETQDLDFRFDMYAGHMHMRFKGQTYAIVHPELISSISTDNYRFVYSAIAKSPDSQSAKDSSYFIVEVDGKCKLLIRKSVRIQDAEPPKLYQDAKPAKFIVKSDAYYLKLGDTAAIPVSGKAELLKILQSSKEAVSEFIDKNKLGVKSGKDLAKIVTYYNSL